MNMPPARQSGATLLILMLVMMTVFATLLVSSLRGRNAEDLRREQSAAAIEKARQALLAWSLSRTSSGSSVDSPVELPCPADPNESNVSQVGMSRSLGCNGAAATYRIGLLPWRTLGIPRLVDGYGEPLWYSVDLGVVARKKDESRKVNGDSFAFLKVHLGTNELTLNGEGAAAVIFAAGPPLAGQARASPYVASQYLEGVAAYNNSSLGGPFVVNNLSETFNDQLGILTSRELIDGARTRLGVEVAKLLNVYYQAAQATTPVGSGAGGACGTTWSASASYEKDDVVSYSGNNWRAKIKNANNNPPGVSNAGWQDLGVCSSTAVPLTAGPYPANLVSDSNCQNNSLIVGVCPSQTNLCAGILPRAKVSWTGEGLMVTAAPFQMSLWFQQNIWHRAVFYAVKQGSVCTTPFTIDGVTDATIDALYILPSAARTQRANNLRTPDTVATASTNLALYLDDAENQDAWTADNYRYVTPSCTSNDLMYTCSKGVCNKRKRAC
nr:hypothetical protein [uncultured Deefgea sp.]